MSDSVASCPPLVVNFTNQSLHFNQLLWDFGDGNKSALPNPSHFYTYSGVYRAKLIITSPGGCQDSMIKTITVKGPQGNFTYDKLKGCIPTTVRFTAQTNQSVRFVWDYNDGTVDEGNHSSIAHTYTTMGEYLPKLILEDAQGCRVPIQGKDTIRIYGVITSFTSSEELLCDSGLVRFTNTTVSNDLITRYNWLFGDGQTSGERNPSHFYRQSGQYTVRLTVTTQAGCQDSARLPLPLKIVSSPLAAIQGIRGLYSGFPPIQGQFVAARYDRNAMAMGFWQWQYRAGTKSTSYYLCNSRFFQYPTDRYQYGRLCRYGT
nr:PKD domain-containing protein [Paraflavitalea speifideiaquila]